MTPTMQMRRILIITLIAVFGGELLFAAAGSPYSRFGVGDRRHLASVRSIGLGGAGIAIRAADHLNISNPAGWSDLFVVQFNGSLLYESLNLNDGILSDGIATGGINSALLALPVMPSRGATVAFGFAPMTRVGYNIETRDEIDGGSQFTKYTGTGGITNLIGGTSLRLHQNLSVGVAALYRMGILSYEWSAEYTVPGFRRAYSLRELDVKGIAGHFGLLYSGLVPPRREGEVGPLTIGIVFTTPTRLDAEERFYVEYATGIDTTISTMGTVELPYTVGMGIHYRIDRRNIVVADVRHEPWDNFRKFGEPDSQLRNSLRIGAGWERQGQYEVGAGFFERTSFRLGVSHNASYFNIQGTPINESFFTVGLGIPLSGIAVLDIGAQIGVRGTTENNLQRDTVFRLFMSINLFERWFVPPIIE